MVVVIRGVVRRRAVAEVGVRDEAELFEQFERPVDGGDVDAAGGRTYPLGDLVRRGVPERGAGLEDELALRRQPVSPRPQVLMPRRGGIVDHVVMLEATQRLSCRISRTA